MEGEPRYPFVHVDVAPADVDETSALLFELGAEGVEERDDTTLAKASAAGKVTLVAAFSTRADAEAAIGQLDAAMSPRYEEVVGDAWRDAWKEHYKPYAIVDDAPRARIVVRPPWEEYAAREGDRVLVLEPGRAFGTGLHETTRLVAQALARHAGALAATTVVDLGCGSGILSLVALVLGADCVVAIDTDPDAVAVTQENAARNGLEARVEATTKDLSKVGVVAPVLLANIEARVLVPLAKKIAHHVAPEGLLFLSGILLPQRDEVRAAYPGFDVLESADLGEWTMLALKKRA